ncbi:MAG: LysR family transcriptional regulator [Eubacterium sp.]|nr:LysR family transcriptional regulator [Eubacterium sp.]
MNYQRIRYFLHAAKTGSFSKAAAEAFVSAQALTKQIRLLEEDLGGELFVRSSQGVTLTTLGEYAYEKLSKIDNELTETFGQIRRHAGDNKLQINIGFFSSLPQGKLVSPLITFILGRYPQYRININMVELDEGKEMLFRGQLDMLFTNTHQEDDWTGYEMRTFTVQPAKVIVSLLHPWAVRDTIDADDMKQEVFLKMNMDSTHYKMPEAQTFYANIPCKYVQECHNFNTLLALLQQGKGFAVFPEAFAHMEQSQIKTFDYPGGELMFRTALLYEKGGMSKELRQLVEDITTEFDLDTTSS